MLDRHLHLLNMIGLQAAKSADELGCRHCEHSLDVEPKNGTWWETLRRFPLQVSGFDNPIDSLSG